MTGLRSCRKLEAACRDQIPYLWLTRWQHPDHNTLWRFYQRDRMSMRELFKRTVRTAVTLELVDLAVDGTKVIANAELIKTCDARRLQELLDRVESAMESLEAQNESGEDAVVARLPEKWSEQKALRHRVRQAMKERPERARPTRYKRPAHINLTDRDARLMKTRQGIVPIYNAQAMVSSVLTDERVTGMLVTASDVVDESYDTARLTSMVEQPEETTGERVPMTLADAGYFADRHVEELHRRGQQVAMPDAARPTNSPYHKDQFIYDEKTDSYRCPNGWVLPFAGMTNNRQKLGRFYRMASGSACRECPAFGICIIDERNGRSIEVGPHKTALRRHQDWMATREAQMASLRDHQEPAWSATIHAAGDGQCDSGMEHACDRIQYEDPLAGMENRHRHPLEPHMMANRNRSLKSPTSSPTSRASTRS